jgi:hypothetical protein
MKIMLYLIFGICLMNNQFLGENENQELGIIPTPQMILFNDSNFNLGGEVTISFRSDS